MILQIQILEDKTFRKFDCNTAKTDCGSQFMTQLGDRFFYDRILDRRNLNKANEQQKKNDNRQRYPSDYFCCFYEKSVLRPRAKHSSIVNMIRLLKLCSSHYLMRVNGPVSELLLFPWTDSNKLYFTSFRARTFVVSPWVSRTEIDFRRWSIRRPSGLIFLPRVFLYSRRCHQNWFK